MSSGKPKRKARESKKKETEKANLFLDTHTKKNSSGCAVALFWHLVSFCFSFSRRGERGRRCYYTSTHPLLIHFQADVARDIATRIEYKFIVMFVAPYIFAPFSPTND